MKNNSGGLSCFHDDIYISLPSCEINILLNAEKILVNGQEHCDLFLLVESGVNCYDYILIEAKNYNNRNSIDEHMLKNYALEIVNKCISTKCLIDKDFEKFMKALNTNKRVKLNHVFLLYVSDFIYEFFETNSAPRIQLKNKLKSLSGYGINQIRLHKSGSKVFPNDLSLVLF